MTSEQEETANALEMAAIIRKAAFEAVRSDPGANARTCFEVGRLLGVLDRLVAILQHEDAAS